MFCFSLLIHEPMKSPTFQDDFEEMKHGMPFVAPGSLRIHFADLLDKMLASLLAQAKTCRLEIIFFSTCQKNPLMTKRV